MALNINRKYIAYLGELPSIMLYSALQPHIESNVFSLLLPFLKGRILSYSMYIFYFTHRKNKFECNLSLYVQSIYLVKSKLINCNYV